MDALLRIKRQSNADAQARWETFGYEGDGKLSIADLLTQLNTRPNLCQIDGTPATRIAWDCSCLQKKCGACSMVINGNPALACAVFVCDAVKNSTITIEPLGKFPVVKDLKVDRSPAFQMLQEMRLWVEDPLQAAPAKDRELRFESSECLMCGCCLEICPNYSSSRNFGGAASMMNAYTAMTAEANRQARKQLGKEYEKHFVFGCGESLSCKDICPAQLPLDKIQARANKIR